MTDGQTWWVAHAFTTEPRAFPACSFWCSLGGHEEKSIDSYEPNLMALMCFDTLLCNRHRKTRPSCLECLFIGTRFYSVSLRYVLQHDFYFS
jgi:hypothetical protein